MPTRRQSSGIENRFGNLQHIGSANQPTNPRDKDECYDERLRTHPSSGVFASMRGDHAGLRVGDLDAAVAWYRDKLDFRVVRAFELNSLTFTEMALAGEDVFRLELVSGAGAADRPNTDDLMDSFRLHGWHYLCLRVDDIDETVAELKGREVYVTLEPHYNPDWKVRVAFFSDPWGNMFELLQPSDGDRR